LLSEVLVHGAELVVISLYALGQVFNSSPDADLDTMLKIATRHAHDALFQLAESG